MTPRPAKRRVVVEFTIRQAVDLWWWMEYQQPLPAHARKIRATLERALCAAKERP